MCGLVLVVSNDNPFTINKKFKPRRSGNCGGNCPEITVTTAEELCLIDGLTDDQHHAMADAIERKGLKPGEQAWIIMDDGVPGPALAFTGEEWDGLVKDMAAGLFSLDA